MNKGHTPIKAGFVQRNQWRLILGGVILLLAALLGWKYYDNRYPSWYEEVRLSDGRVITIHQKHEYYDNYGTNQSWVEIDLPELGGKRVWHSYLMPQRVDVVDGKIYVFGPTFRAEKSMTRKHLTISFSRLQFRGLAAFRLNFGGARQFVRAPLIFTPLIGKKGFLRFANRNQPGIF